MRRLLVIQRLASLPRDSGGASGLPEWRAPLPSPLGCLSPLLVPRAHPVAPPSRAVALPHLSRTRTREQQPRASQSGCLGPNSFECTFLSKMPQRPRKCVILFVGFSVFACSKFLTYQGPCVCGQGPPKPAGRWAGRPVPPHAGTCHAPHTERVLSALHRTFPSA